MYVCIYVCMYIIYILLAIYISLLYTYSIISMHACIMSNIFQLRRCKITKQRVKIGLYLCNYCVKKQI